MRRTLLLLLMTLLLAAAPTGALRAEEAKEDPGFRMYEKQAKKILKSAGNKVWEAAEHAYRTGLMQFAHEQAKRAISFDPNQGDARDYLCYEKKSKGWVQDEEAYEKLRKQNVRPSKNGKQMSKESFDALVKKWREERLLKADQFVAARYAKLGAVCVKKGFPLQARKGYEYAHRACRQWCCSRSWRIATPASASYPAAPTPGAPKRAWSAPRE